MSRTELLTPDGYPISFDFFLGLSCPYVNKQLLNASNVTEVYESLLVEVTNGGAGLWNQKGGCYGQMCRVIFGSGNPDISGIGLVIAYALEICLAFVLSTLLLFLWSRLGRPDIVAREHPTTNALCKSTAAFADTALFFALAVVVATSVIMSSIYHWPIRISLYDALQAVVSCTITMAPCLVVLFTLQCCGEKIGRRLSILGLACFINFFVLILPTIIAFALSWEKRTFVADPQLKMLANVPSYSLRMAKNYTGPLNTNYQIWFETCFALSTSSFVLLGVGAFITIAGQLLILGLVILFSLPFIRLRLKGLTCNVTRFRNGARLYPPPLPEELLKRTIQRKEDSPRSHLPRKLEIFAFVILPLLLCVVAGAVLLGFRFILSKAWNSDVERRWGFGQVVGALLFLPVLVELPYHWFIERPSSSDEMRVTYHKPSQTSADGSMTDMECGTPNHKVPHVSMTTD